MTLELPMHVEMLAMLQTPEIIGLLVLALIFFGAKKLPELARGLGSGIKEFRKATRDVTDELQSAIETDPTPTRRPAPVPDSYALNSGTEESVSQSQPSDQGGIDTLPQPEPASKVD